MTPEIAKLKEWIDGTKNIVFFGGAGVSTESGIQIFVPWTAYTIKNMTGLRKPFCPTLFSCARPQSFTVFTAIKCCACPQSPMPRI